MTPLGLLVAKDMLLPPERRMLGRRRTTDDDESAAKGAKGAESVWAHFGRAQFFEVTEALACAEALAADIQRFGPDERLMFLPAPVTWLEYHTPELGRRALMIVAEDGATEACITFCGSDKAKQPTAFAFSLPLSLRPPPTRFHPDWPLHDHSPNTFSEELLWALLTIINTPRVARQAHGVHRGLLKRAAKQGVADHFPTGGWTEVRLRPTPQTEAKDADATSAKPYHHVRAHWKPRAQVHIPAHWKGDITLGVKRSRYIVEPPA